MPHQGGFRDWLRVTLANARSRIVSPQGVAMGLLIWAVIEGVAFLRHDLTWTGFSDVLGRLGLVFLGWCIVRS